MATTWVGAGGNLQISSNGTQNIKSDGYVTKKYHGYGCIDKNTLFNFSVVQGPVPNVGDKVSYEAQRSTAAQCWNATKVKVVQFAQSAKSTDTNTQQQQQQQSQTGYQGQHQYQQQQKYNAAPPQQQQKYSAAPSRNIQPPSQAPSRTSLSRFSNQQQPGSYNQKRQQNPQQQQRSQANYSAVAPPMAQIVGQPALAYKQQGNKRSRFDTGPAGQKVQGGLPRKNSHAYDRKPRPRSRSPPRRSRSKSRSPSRSSSESTLRSPTPRRKRSPKPRYSVRCNKFNLLRPDMDTLCLQRTYTSLYVPSDVGLVVRHGVFASGEVIPYTNIVRYHVASNSTVGPATGGSKTHRAKVLLLRSISKTKLYHSILNEKREQLLKLLRFWCCYSDKEITAFGGAWSGELDGPDPDNPQTLINTAVRHVKSQIGLDLSCCKSWYKICEVHYHRVSDKEHVERTVMYLPSVWDCQPNQEDWDTLKHPLSRSVIAAAPAPAVEAVKEEVEVEVAPSTSEDPAPEDFTPKSDAVKQELVDLSCGDMTLDFSAEADETNVTEAGVAEPHSHGESGTCGLTETDIKNMKVTELRSELDTRGLSTKGLKIQLIARLVKAVKEQSGETSKDSPTSVTEDKSSHWKLQPEAQKRMNALIARMGIVEKDIPDLPDLASIVLRPAKGVEVSDYSLASLLDYQSSDRKERVFEVSIFAEVLSDMFQRHFALLLLKALIEAEGDSEEEAKLGKRTRSDTEGSETKKESESKEEVAKPEKYVHRPDLLLAFLYFDKNRVGYIAEDDILAIIHSIGLGISRSQIKLILDKVSGGRSRLVYKSLCEKEVKPDEPHTIQQESVSLTEIEEVLMIGRGDEVRTVAIVESSSTSVKLEPAQAVMADPEDDDVVTVNGSYVVRSELPELLSKALVKVSSLESELRDLDRKRSKLERAADDSRSMRHNFSEMEREMKTRKKELDILSEEKTKAELATRRYKTALDSTRTALQGVMGNIGELLEDDKKTEKKA